MKEKRHIVFILVFLFAVTCAWAEDVTVYATKTGKKYHVLGCTYLKESSIPISLPEAISRGLEPCSRCHPPAPATPSPPQSPEKPELYRVPNIPCSSGADLSRMLPARVSKHVDGDTVHVTIENPPEGIRREETIRLLGIDTPETVDPRKTVQPFGKEASEYTKDHLLGKDVLLAFDWDLRDRYDRLLAYIFYSDGGCFNAGIVGDGYAHAYLSFPFQFMEEFRLLERQARVAGRGMWGVIAAAPTLNSGEVLLSVRSGISDGEMKFAQNF